MSTETTTEASVHEHVIVQRMTEEARDFALRVQVDLLERLLEEGDDMEAIENSGTVITALLDNTEIVADADTEVV